MAEVEEAAAEAAAEVFEGVVAAVLVEVVLVATLQEEEVASVEDAVVGVVDIRHTEKQDIKQPWE